MTMRSVDPDNNYVFLSWTEKPRDAWVNIYESGIGFLYPSREAVIRRQSQKPLYRIHVIPKTHNASR